MQHEGPLEVAAKGVLGGLVGTAIITIGMMGAPILMKQLGLTQSQVSPPRSKEGKEPTEKLAEEIATDVLETPLDEDTKKAAGQAIHWGYGMTWGALYGLAQSQLQLPHHLHGLLFGGLVGLVASTVVPAMDLTPPPTREPIAKNAMMLSLHLLYGWVTAQTFHALSSET